jgi:hypothetical protein
MQFIHKNLRLLLLGLVLVVLGALISYAIFHNDSSSKPSADPGHVTINDETAGLSFNMSNNFQAIPKEALTLFNGDALYAFRVPDDKNAQCLISQAEPSSLTAGELRDGVFNEIKNNHPDAKLDSSATVLVGVARGVSIQISYTDNGNKIKRVEIAAGKTNLTFAYCQSLAIDSAKYYNDFTTFFSSLKLTK